jgi:hypothetical protein
MWLRVNQLIGFFLIAIFFLTLFGIISAVRSIKEPNSIQKIIGLIFNSCLFCIIIVFLGLQAFDLYERNTDIKENLPNTTISSDCIIAELVLPDTVFKEKMYEGKILYTSCFDSINSELHTRIKTRTVKLIFLSADTSNEENMVHEFSAKNNREIDFKVQFLNAGQNTFKGIVIDFVNTNSGNQNLTTDSTHIRTIKTEVEKTIFVR